MNTRHFLIAWARWVVPMVFLAAWAGALIAGIGLAVAGNAAGGATVILGSSAIGAAAVLAWREVRTT